MERYISPGGSSANQITTMNRQISTLAKGARGKAWRSRLVPYEAEIRRLRHAGHSYRGIATWLAENGLVISASAIHGFVRARARRSRGQYALPQPATATTTGSREPISSVKSPLVEYQAVAAEKPVSCLKRFVFTPKRNRPAGFNAEDLQINDPLA